MQDGEGCPLPVLQHYLDSDKHQHLIVWLLSCKAEVIEQVGNIESDSLSEEGMVKLPQAKILKRKLAHHQMSDAGVIQGFETRADFKDVDGGRVTRSYEVTLVRSSDFQSLRMQLRIIANAKTRAGASPIWFRNRIRMPHVSTTMGQQGCKKFAQMDKEVVDNSYLPGLPESVALLCFAYLPPSKHWLLALVSRKHRDLVRSSLLLTLRQQHNILDPWICFFTSGTDVWTAFSPGQNRWRSLPRAAVGPGFISSDKESLAAGTHLLWFSREAFMFACYKYDAVSNSWGRGPSMLNPRCLFGSATCGQYAFVAGGLTVDGRYSPLSSAERYDSLSGLWEPLPPMNTPRQRCSGFFMDGKFYVIGGKVSIDSKQLTSGEEYDPLRRSWRTIENMYSVPRESNGSPPLVAVAGNELYCIESSSNLLKVYDKGINRWRVLGSVPVANCSEGWGVAFKAFGDQLYVIGGDGNSSGGDERARVFSWRPQPGATAPEWQLVSEIAGTGSYLYNCAVMAY